LLAVDKHRDSQQSLQQVNGGFQVAFLDGGSSSIATNTHSFVSKLKEKRAQQYLLSIS
jgi:hypothetical protein